MCQGLASDDRALGYASTSRPAGGALRCASDDAVAASEERDDAEGEAPPIGAREERGGRNRRRRRGRGRGQRRVYEVDGGEWIDFVSSDLKHLSPRPERGGRIAAVAAQVEVEPETEEAPSADIIVHPAAEPVLEPAMAMADTAPAAEAAPAETPPRYDADSLTYEPDQERREKFLSRFSRWGKKGG